MPGKGKEGKKSFLRPRKKTPCSSREACFVTVKKRSSPPPSSGVQSVWKSIAGQRRRLRIKKSFGEAPTEFVALSRQQREKILVGPAKIEGGLRSRWSSPHRQLWIAQKKEYSFGKRDEYISKGPKPQVRRSRRSKTVNIPFLLFLKGML